MKGQRWRQATVVKVIDGDTLELAGGERVRMIGINAPETAKFGKPDDPLGHAAWLRLQALAPAGTALFLRRDRAARDRYGRELLHPFDSHGRNITGLLLAEGMGFHVVFPPNLWLADCYRATENQAAEAGMGVWGLAHYAPVEAVDLERLRGGYGRVIGQVESLVMTRRSAWLELRGAVSIKVAKADLGTVDGEVWQRIVLAAQQGKTAALPRLEVRGWMSDRREWDAGIRRQIADGIRKPFQFNVYHRYHWKLLDVIHSDQPSPQRHKR